MLSESKNHSFFVSILILVMVFTGASTGMVFSEPAKIPRNLTNDQILKNSQSDSGLLILWGAIIGALGGIGGSMIGTIVTYYKDKKIEDNKRQYEQQKVTEDDSNLRKIVYLELKYYQDFFKSLEEKSVEDQSKTDFRHVKVEVDNIRFRWNSRPRNYQNLDLDIRLRAFSENVVELESTYNNIAKFNLSETPNPLTYQKKQLELLSQSISKTINSLKGAYRFS